MSSIVLDNILATLQKQRSDLRMPYGVLAKRSGLSLSTVQRAMNGDLGRTKTLLSLAAALGVRFEVRKSSPRAIRNKQAAEKADKLTKFAQGNAAMEGQGVGQETVREVRQNIKDSLLGGAARRLWGE